ncbi:MAG: methylated-DNA--[protein]-cysteine S-methyltransferase [Phycisphaerales bacterium]|jgi:methylated-DNA-[protein]-cysteine S-methyltransferase|nr:methylated-DNA--[protein]-cysteine S-methyltransferase [Planctomycetota bacterium]
MTSIDTPCGRFWCGVDSENRPWCGWVDLLAAPESLRPAPAAWRLPQRLAHWFEDAGARRADRFLDLPLPAGSAFSDRCREALRRRSLLAPITYGQLASSIGHRGAARAVGRAMRTNPAPVLVPCHRVVAAGGRLGGYSGEANSPPSVPSTGLDRTPPRSDSRTVAALRIKRTLLELEAAASDGPIESRPEATNRLQSQAPNRR